MKLNMHLDHLSSQIFAYSLDTSAFYTDEEQRIHHKLMTLYQQRAALRANKGRSESAQEAYKQMNQQIKAIKNDELFVQFARQKSSGAIRELREDAMTYQAGDEGERKPRKHAVIAMFESALTRLLGVRPGTLTTDIIIVQQYYGDVMEDLVKGGFAYNGERYMYLSSSAGQIRKKKCVFMRSAVWDVHKDTIMCGLTLDKINRKGANPTKFLAYLSLQDSASAPFADFDMDRVIVVDDWEFPVEGVVDYIDNATFAISRRKMKVGMNIADGAGMCLPSVSRRSFQFRAPWMKGLISPMDFREWAKRNGCTTVADIWGDTYDLVEDRIEIMITKSMFKMWNHYPNWAAYKACFNQYRCTANVCQIEAQYYGNVRLGYQMLQSLNLMTDEELTQISRKTNDDIRRVGSDRDTMLKILGATKENRDKNHYQVALMLYPQMLNDTYSHKIIKDVKKKLVKEARSGRIEVEGKYLFVCPDWVAYLQWLLKKEEEPGGLIGEGEVYSRLFADGEKVDVMRSPSLYREHGIRRNRVQDERKKWLIGNGIYVGYKDLLGKLLMMDFDGDQLFVVKQQQFVAIAERHMRDVVPLHYEMKKAGVVLINSDTLWDGLKAAFKANIGDISNKISICWNVGKPNLDVIKQLVLLNNATIDYAKTLWMPELPAEISKKIGDNVKGKLPHFFKYAKGKAEGEVQRQNDSTVNRLAGIIENKRIYFEQVCGNFDYKNLLSHPLKQVEMSPAVMQFYKQLDQGKWSMDAYDKQDAERDCLFAYREIRDEMLGRFPEYGESEIVDMLVEYLYAHAKSDYKVTLWTCFGDTVLENVKRNLGKYKNCEDCGCEYEGHHNSKLCEHCAATRQREAKKRNKLRKRLG